LCTRTPASPLCCARGWGDWLAARRAVPCEAAQSIALGQSMEGRGMPGPFASVAQGAVCMRGWEEGVVRPYGGECDRLSDPAAEEAMARSLLQQDKVASLTPGDVMPAVGRTSLRRLRRRGGRGSIARRRCHHLSTETAWRGSSFATDRSLNAHCPSASPASEGPFYTPAGRTPETERAGKPNGRYAWTDPY
jgi:hypothetical protein